MKPIVPLNDDQRRRAAEHVPPARRLARLYCLARPWLDRDEVLSAALLGLVGAASRYEDGKGATFRTFAFRKIWYAMKSYARDFASAPRATGSISDFEPIAETAARRADVIHCVDSVVRKLPRRYGEVFRLVYEGGLTLAEASKATGLCPSRVTRIHEDGLQLLRTLVVR